MQKERTVLLFIVVVVIISCIVGVIACYKIMKCMKEENELGAKEEA